MGKEREDYLGVHERGVGCAQNSPHALDESGGKEAPGNKEKAERLRDKHCLPPSSYDS